MHTGREKSTVPSRLRAAREAAGLSQSQVAKLLGLSRPSVSEMEAGRRRVSLEEARLLAELYRVGLAWLAGQDESEATENDDRIRLAARELGKLKPQDVDSVIQLLRAMKRKRD